MTAAAERLYLLFANHKDATDSQWLEADFLLTDALAAERRATLERIRDVLPRMMKAALPGAFLQADDIALGVEAAGRVLDEEASR